MARSEEVIQLRKLSQRWAYTSIQMHEAIGRKMDLPGTDHKYLGFFLQKGQMTAGELALLTGLTTGAVTGLIDRFAKKKLVKRLADKQDRRKVIIVPNIEKITALLLPLYQNYQDQTDRFFSTFSAIEFKTLERYFNGALELMNIEMSLLQPSTTE